MIEAHAFDSWTRDAARHSIAWRNLVILAGFAAPLFLFLAGVAVVLSATRAAARTGSRAGATEAVVRRGLEILVLGFLFRVQAYVLSPGSSLLTIFRVDILNVMGPSIAIAGVVWGLCSTAPQRVVAFSIVAAAMVFATPYVYTTRAVDALPALLRWYVLHSGEYTTFAALPWAEFVFAGAAVGALIGAPKDEASARTTNFGLAVAGALLVAVGFFGAAQPRVFAGATFWTTSPTWAAIRVGVMVVMLAGFGKLERTVTNAFGFMAALARLGRSSLFVYWIHVELVYGYASYYWWKALPLWGSAVGYVLFCAAMYGAVVLRDRAAAAWRARSGRAQILTPSVAGQA